MEPPAHLFPGTCSKDNQAPFGIESGLGSMVNTGGNGSISARASPEKVVLHRSNTAVRASRAHAEKSFVMSSVSGKLTVQRVNTRWRAAARTLSGSHREQPP